MIKFQSKELQNIKIAFQELNMLILPYEISKRLSNFIKNVLIPEMEFLDAERLKLLKELADKDEKNQPIQENGVYKLSPENNQKGIDLFFQYLEKEISVDFIPFKEEILKNKEIRTATIDLLLHYGFMVE
jgi:hypothetical protein